MREELARQTNFFEEFGELEDFFVSLPYSDLHRWIPEGSIQAEAWSPLRLGRLAEVKQLSFLS